MDLNQVKSLFTATDFERGMEYYRKGRVTDIQCTKAGTETNVSCTVRGSERYTVRFTEMAEGRLRRSCTSPRGAAAGRPRPPLDPSPRREAVEDGVSGYLCPAKDADALYGAMQRVMELSVEQRSEMGCRGRERMEQQFSKTAVVTETIKHLEI